jgi:hypothetical protein
MIASRLPALGSIAVIVVMIFNGGVAIAVPNETSADLRLFPQRGMSAYGTKRTWCLSSRMSAFGGIADISWTRINVH